MGTDLGGEAELVRGEICPGSSLEGQALGLRPTVRGLSLLANHPCKFLTTATGFLLLQFSSTVTLLWPDFAAGFLAYS